MIYNKENLICTTEVPTKKSNILVLHMENFQSSIEFRMKHIDNEHLLVYWRGCDHVMGSNSGEKAKALKGCSSGLPEHCKNS